MMKTKILALVSVGALATGLAACSSPEQADEAPTTEVTQAQEDDSNGENPTDEDDKNEASSKVFSDTEGGIKAVKAAEAVNGGKAVEVDREDSDQAWEVTVIEGKEEVTYAVSAEGSAKEVKRDTADEDDLAAVGTAISMLEALENAAKEVPDGFLDEVELDDKDGHLVYEIEFDDADGHDYKQVLVDAKTGGFIDG